MVSNGLVLVGDAACQVNPIHGGGIGPSMVAGRIAGEVVAKALEKGEASRENLWEYNRRFMEVYGAKQAGLDVFRMFLQGLSDEDLNYGMSRRLLREEDVLRVSVSGEVELGVGEKLSRALRGLSKPLFLLKLRAVLRMVKRVKKFYLNYPDPKGFEGWRRRVENAFREVSKFC